MIQTDSVFDSLKWFCAFWQNFRLSEIRFVDVLIVGLFNACFQALLFKLFKPSGQTVHIKLFML